MTITLDTGQSHAHVKLPNKYGQNDRHLIMSNAHVYNKCPFSV